jgi:hypothetical protein
VCVCVCVCLTDKVGIRIWKVSGLIGWIWIGCCFYDPAQDNWRNESNF